MIIVIVGPTGVGKTKLSIELAKKYDGEIINFDSVQIYKELNIGSAKVTTQEMENIPHHLIDFVDINEPYTVYDYQTQARREISQLEKKGKTIIMVGGTGLYAKSVLYDYNFTNETITNNYENLSTEYLYNKALSIDKECTIPQNNRRRLIRFLNYYDNHNESMRLNNNGDKKLYNFITIGLTTDRSILYQRINNRVDKMIEQGLINEAHNLYKRNIHSKATQSIGYKELYNYFDKKISLEEAINDIKRNSRRYAKRQYTFFNNKMDVKWFNVNFENFNETVGEVITYINKKNNSN